MTHLRSVIAALPAASLALASMLMLAPFLAATPAVADQRFCPPGLAKKDPPCIPPGQARRGGGGHGDDDDHADRDRSRYDDDDHADRDWSYYDRDDDAFDHMVGDLLRDGEYVLVRNPELFGLDPYANQNWRYYLMRDMIVRGNPETRRVLGVIGLVDTLMN